MPLRVFVAAHKPYDLPTDAVYEGLHVGHANATVDIGFTADDTGDNISHLNPSYCELTGLYWFWRNTAHDAYGLAHYRRHFAGAGWRGTATGEEMVNWLASADVVVPRRRNYVIETVRSQYSRAHHGSDLDATREAISELSPGYLPAFDRVMARRTLSLYNMFLMRRELLDDYASWVFPVLRRAGEGIDLSSYGPQQLRVFGYLGERLFNVWLEHNSDRLKIRRQRVVSLEGENYAVKAWGLIKRRFGRGRAH